MNRLVALASAVFVFSMAVPDAQSQTGAVSDVFFDAVSFAGPSRDSTRLDLFLAVPHGALSFERAHSNFTARYRVQFEITRDARRLYDTSFERVVTTRSPEVASGDRPSYDFFQLQVFLEPGTYESRVSVVDARTSFESSARRIVHVDDYSSRALMLSGLLLVERIREDSTGFVLTPRLSDMLGGDPSEFFVFFEAYNGGDTADVRLKALYGDDNSSSGPESFVRTIPSGRSQHWLRLDASEIPPNARTLGLEASLVNDTTRVIASTKRPIRVETGSSSIPLTEALLDERISQLRYVALQSEIDAIRESGSLVEKRKRYAAYWSRLDPTPGTPENEALIEYYTRIDVAQEKFRSYSPGWMTDPGRVYVLYGPPDNVLRDPFATDSRRIETWQYYSRGNLQIVFQDDSGFGDYRLITPISHLEKYRYGQ